MLVIVFYTISIIIWPLESNILIGNKKIRELIILHYVYHLLFQNSYIENYLNPIETEMTPVSDPV